MLAVRLTSRLYQRRIKGRSMPDAVTGPCVPEVRKSNLGGFIKPRPVQRSHVVLVPYYARCMAQKWRVKVTTGAPDEAKAQDIVRRLPDDSRPAYIGFGDDLALRIVAVSVEANDEATARTNAIRLVKDACRAVDWDWEPEARSITAAVAS